MTLLFPIVGLGEQPAHQLDEHHYRIVSELLTELDDLRDDCRTPSAGIDVAGEPGRRGVSLPHHLVPPSRRDSSLQTGVDLERAQVSDTLR